MHDDLLHKITQQKCEESSPWRHVQSVLWWKTSELKYFPLFLYPYPTLKAALIIFYSCFFFFFLLIAAGSVHIPMHLSTCQHHQATNSTFVPQKLASRNESSPAREEKRQSSTTATKNDQHQPRHANTSKGISKVQQLPL